MIKNYISIIILSILSLPCFCTPENSIVFIHLGNEVPKHTFIALKQARLFNDCPIFLLLNNNASNKLTELEKIELETTHINIVFAEQLKRIPAHSQFCNSTQQDKNFREGFWVKTTERLFYLEELMNDLNLSHVIHIENDNMIYFDTASLVPILAKHYAVLAAPFDNQNRCILSILYIPSSNHLSPLTTFIAKEACSGLNEMLLVAKFKNSNPNGIDALPIIFEEYDQMEGLYKDRQGKYPVSFFSKYMTSFNSIFDAAALGQFLGGIDPRNGESKPGFINETCVFNPSKCTYTWETDTQNRKIPYIKFGNSKYRINNLHIHCKELAKFVS